MVVYHAQVMQNRIRYHALACYWHSTSKGWAPRHSGLFVVGRSRKGRPRCGLRWSLAKPRTLLSNLAEPAQAPHERIARPVLPMSVLCSTAPGLHPWFGVDGERRGADIASPSPCCAGPTSLPSGSPSRVHRLPSANSTRHPTATLLRRQLIARGCSRRDRADPLLVPSVAAKGAPSQSKLTPNRVELDACRLGYF